jgi:hypothetical protein
MQSTIRIGTRGNPLALRQADEVRARSMAAHGLKQDDFTTVIVKTSGDMAVDRPLADIGGKELFTREIEQALIDRRDSHPWRQAERRKHRDDGGSSVSGWGGIRQNSGC